jgi:pyruvate dehydrogenase E2 component (dihydrolipoamide acetyltransferase)
MIQDIVIPNIGEKVESGTVVAILVAVGDRVAVDDGIVEFETEKAVVEIPSPLDGKIVEILVAEGAELRIGDVVARLETAEAAEQDAADPPDEEAHRPAPATAEETDKEAAPSEPPRDERTVAVEPRSGSDETTDVAADQPAMPAAAAPSVRRLARELGVDILQVRGSGPGGRISDKDVRDHAASQTSRPETDSQASLDRGRPMELPDFTRWGPVEAVKMTTVRKITAESMSHAWRTIPHVTQFDRADISHVEAWLETVNKNAGKTGGKLTLTAVLMKVVAQGLKKFPNFNASLDMQKQQIYLKGYIHLGLAVDTERGLLVPVLRDVDQKSIHDIADEIRDLVERARTRRIQPDEMQGGTFTVSNQGGIGGVNFTPIVYWPQAAILGVSRSAIEPRYMDETWHPRTILPLSLSYDHRLNDGADAARFLQWICHALEYPMALQ